MSTQDIPNTTHTRETWGPSYTQHTIHRQGPQNYLQASYLQQAPNPAGRSLDSSPHQRTGPTRPGGLATHERVALIRNLDY